MKKTLLALAIVASAQLSAFAQGYTFTKSTGTYADLTGSTVVSTPGWQPSATTAFTIPIGFNFVLDGTTFTTMEGSALGDLAFTNGTVEKFIFGFDGILVDKSSPSTTSTLSPVSYALTGSAGNRILKVEYKNAGVVTPPSQPGGQATVNPSDVANFQIWLFEGSNKIEVHYGAVSVANIPGVFFGENGPTVAVVSELAASVSGFFLQGQAANPTLLTLTQANTYPGLTGIPASGTIYTFNTSTSTTGIAKNFQNAAISVYPNPATDVVKIAGLTKGNVTVKIHDALGKVVLTNEMAAANNASINVSNLPKGAYYMEIVSEEGRMSKQFIKQ